jgi:hypothetical protein
VFQIFDQVTEHSGALQTSAVAVAVDVAAKHCRILRDLELLELLNQLSSALSEARAKPADIKQAVELAEVDLNSRIQELRLPFVTPTARVQVILWPA